MSAVCGLARQSMLCKMHEVCPRVCSKGGVCNVFVCVCEVCGLNGARVPTTGARPAAGRGAVRGRGRWTSAGAYRRRAGVGACGVYQTRAAAPRARRGAGGLVVVLSVILKHLKKLFCVFLYLIRADRAAVQSRVAIQ